MHPFSTSSEWSETWVSISAILMLIKCLARYIIISTLFYKTKLCCNFIAPLQDKCSIFITFSQCSYWFGAMEIVYNSNITFLIWNLNYCEVSGWTIRIYPNILLHVDSRWSPDRQGCRISNKVVNCRFFNFLKEINSSKLLAIFY